jgi:hypothetical protein
MADSPEIDLSKIEFPSDRVTIKDIRRLWPEAVDTGKRVDLFSKPVGGGAGEMLFSMLTMERDLAKATFGLKLGREPAIPYADDDVKLLADDLSQVYTRYGIADGPSSAKELIRGIESQALAQAQQHIPPRS